MRGREIDIILILLGGFILYEIFKATPALPAGATGVTATQSTAPLDNSGNPIPPQPAGPCPANSQWIWNGNYWTCALISQTTQTPNQTSDWWSTVWGWISPANWD